MSQPAVGTSGSFKFGKVREWDHCWSRSFLREDAQGRQIARCVTVDTDPRQVKICISAGVFVLLVSLPTYGCGRICDKGVSKAGCFSCLDGGRSTKSWRNSCGKEWSPLFQIFSKPLNIDMVPWGLEGTALTFEFLHCLFEMQHMVTKDLCRRQINTATPTYEKCFPCPFMVRAEQSLKVFGSVPLVSCWNVSASGAKDTHQHNCSFQIPSGILFFQ